MLPKFSIEASRLTITFCFRHPLGAVGKVDADDRRQQLRRQPDRQRQGKKEGFQDRTPEEDVDGEDDHHQDERHLHQEIAESPNAALEFRFLGPQFQPFRHLAEFGLLAGDDDERLGAAADYVGSHPQRVGPLR